MAEWKYGDVLKRPDELVREMGKFSADERVMFVAWAATGRLDDRPFTALVLSSYANGVNGGLTNCWATYWEPVDD